MHLKSLTLKGFKSFASATTLKFEPGICAVVGPNGSGKSNVVDALAWVMGEQGAKTLRGGKMEDVIFAGAGERKALGRAEVTLTIDNTDGALPIEYTEVAITRRMFRDGASEYEINGAKARLMDVQELLSDSGIGREMHVIVGQGRLAQILESRPEERRAFIEEAAGVLKHKRRKEKAERKLQSMQTNVDRLQDLLTELEKQLKPLSRQAAAAQRAATVQATVRELKLTLAAYQTVSLQARLDDATAAHEQAAETVAQALAAFETASEEVAAAETELAELVPQAEAAHTSWFELSALAERISATARIAHDRARHGEALAWHGADLAELEETVASLEEEAEIKAEEVAVAAEELAEITAQVAEAAAASQAAEAEHLAQVRAVADQREGLARLVTQLEANQAALELAEAEVERLSEEQAGSEETVLEAEERALAAAEALEAALILVEPKQQEAEQQAEQVAAAKARVQELTATERQLDQQIAALKATIATLAPAAGSAKIATVLPQAQELAQFLGVEQGYAAAVAAALGEAASAVTLLAQQPADLAEVISQITAEVTRTAVVIGEPSGTAPWHLQVEKTGLDWLIDHLSPTKPELVAPLSRLLADVVVAADAATAVELVAAEPRLRAVTLAGEVVGAGWFVAGSGAASAVEVAEQVAAAEAELQAAEQAKTNLAGTLAGAAATEEEAQTAAAAARAALGAAQQAAALAQQQAQQLEQAVAQVQAAASKSGAALARAQQQQEKLLQEQAQLRERLAKAEAQDPVQVEAAAAAREEAAALLAQLKAQEMAARLQVNTAKEQQQHVQQRLRGAGARLQQEKVAYATFVKKQEQRQAEVTKAQEVARWADQLTELVQLATSRAKTARDELAGLRAAQQQAVSAAKEQLQGVDAQRQAVLGKAHQLELALQTATVRWEEHLANLRQSIGIAPEILVAQFAPGEDFVAEQATADLAEAEKALASLGKVNPLALEEYKAQQQRFEYLSGQLQDVEQARQDLRQVIVEVDEKILQLFTSAWQDVAAMFPQVFATLFPGGEGRLVLTDPDDLLATGIEVEARPPGKKVKRLSLLSGGEKSLTALAMLVAIFKARPSPFYVMDEVEAALDDVNLRRLIALFEELRQSSQLIVITHQKPTMNIANVLYGVSMRGDGVTRVVSQRMQPGGQETNAPENR